MGEPKSSPQKSNRSGSRTEWETALMVGIMAQEGQPVAASKMFNVVLFRPEIPPNTGNVIRLCANTGCTLHLVRPLGFELTGKHREAACESCHLTFWYPNEKK